MKFDLSDFLQLDTKGLLAVNGGSPCGGSSSYSGSGGNSNDGGSPGGSGSSSYSGSSGGSGGGSCSGGNSGSDKKSSSGNVYPTKYGPTSPGWWGPTAWSDGSYLDSNGNRVYPNSNKGQTSGGGGSCSSVSGNGSNSAAGTVTAGNETSSTTTMNVGGSTSTSKGQGSSTTSSNPGENINSTEKKEETKTVQELPSYLICTDSNDVHCDIIAWNHAVDARLDPRGENGTDWDANNKTVDQIYNEHFVGKDVAFDGKQAGKKGYILYDWEGDGKYDHIEFGSINEDGLSYSYYSNNGFENEEDYYTRSFTQDSNAHCDNKGNGIVRFIPLN